MTNALLGIAIMLAAAILLVWASPLGKFWLAGVIRRCADWSCQELCAHAVAQSASRRVYEDTLKRERRAGNQALSAAQPAGGDA